MTKQTRTALGRLINGATHTHTGPLTSAGTASSSDLPWLVSINSFSSSRESESPLNKAGMEVVRCSLCRGTKRGGPAEENHWTGLPCAGEGRTSAGHPQYPSRLCLPGIPWLPVLRAPSQNCLLHTFVRLNGRLERHIHFIMGYEIPEAQGLISPFKSPPFGKAKQQRQQPSGPWRLQGLKRVQTLPSECVGRASKSPLA